MLQKNIIKHPRGKVEIQLVIPWEELKQKWNEIYYVTKEQDAIEKIKREFLQKIMPEFLVDAIKEDNSIIPIDAPKYTLLSFELGQSLQFRATITNAPIVKIGDYKNIKVTRLNQSPVLQKDIDHAINDTYKKWQKNQEISSIQSTHDLQNNFLKSMGITSIEDLNIKTKQYLKDYQLYNTV